MRPRRSRDAVAGDLRDVEFAVTASFGVATLLEDTLERDTLLRIADRALYSAKQNGRDRVEASPAATPLTRRMNTGVPGRHGAHQPADVAPAGRACSRARRPCRRSTGSASRGSPGGRRRASPAISFVWWPESASRQQP